MNFKQNLIKFFNGDLIYPNNKYLFVTGKRLFLFINSIKLWNRARYFESTQTASEANTLVRIPTYGGGNLVIASIGKQLNILKNDLIGAYVHGSYADGTNNNYSDFDGLVILKNSVLESPARMRRTASYLIKTRKWMHRIDPLQHHGWFIILEKELVRFPTDYFPLELFNYTKSLIPDMGSQLSICPMYPSKPERRFLSFAESLTAMGKTKNLKTNIYILKCYLSQVMLLPAIYYSAKTGRGIYKKDSFELVRNDFSSDEWKIMDIVSGVRLNWEYSMSFFEKLLLHRAYNPVIRFWVKKKKNLCVRSVTKMNIPENITEMVEKVIFSMKSKLRLQD